MNINLIMKENEYNQLSKIILDAAYTVHKEMGPGLLESIYEHCLLDELRSRGLHAEQQVLLPLYYKKKKLSLAVLTDYTVRIPPGGKSDALCETIITWDYKGREFRTRGLDSDQTVAAIKATQKMLNLI